MVALRNLMKTGGLSALAVAAALTAAPTVASAAPGDNQRSERSRGGAEHRGGGHERRGWGGAEQRAGGQERRGGGQQQAAQARNWGGRDSAERREQRAEQREHRTERRASDGDRARGWGGAGSVTRPAATAWRAQPAVPAHTAWQQRNQTYSDPARNRDHGRTTRVDRPVSQARPDGWQRDGDRWRSTDRNRPTQGWDGQRWRGQNWDRRGDNHGNWQRDHDRNGDRNWDRNRDGNWNRDRNWDRNRDGNWDRNRNWDRHSGNHRWNRDWRRDNRYDWNGWRNQHRHVFRMGRYNPPYRDWSYRRLSIGFYLQSGFYGSNYWLDDPWAYRLPPAHGPYRWVRYYDDALLVNIYDGEVVDVLHDFFW